MTNCSDPDQMHLEKNNSTELDIPFMLMAQNINRSSEYAQMSSAYFFHQCLVFTSNL